MKRKVIYKQFGVTYVTDEDDFNKPITNASKNIKLGLCSYEEAVDYLRRYCNVKDVIFIDKTR